MEGAPERSWPFTEMSEVEAAGGKGHTAGLCKHPAVPVTGCGHGMCCIRFG